MWWAIRVCYTKSVKKLSSAFEIVAVFAIVATSLGAAAEPRLTDIRVGARPEKTRIVLDLSDTVKFRVFTLAAPYRVVVDLPELTVAAPVEAFRRRIGSIKGYRFGLFKPGNSRLVVDTDGPTRVSQAFVLTPRDGAGYRFVMDLVPTDAARFAAALKPAVRSVRPPVVPPRPMAKPQGRSAGPRIIVLDPGHGGVDPGTVGHDGNFEKHLVLKYARAIEQELVKRKTYKVVLTRKRDVFVRLRRRVQIAQDAGADLFISLHADAIADESVRGGAIYTLSEKGSDLEAEALAAKENRSDLIAGITLDEHDDEVVSILIDLAQRETMNYAARFATTVVPEFRRAKIRMRGKPHRFAAFRVLKAPDVASVLLELGYLSNKADATYLQRDSSRIAIVRSVAAAVDSYFKSLEN